MEEATHQFQESLKQLKQTGSIADYQQQFETLSTKIHCTPERWLVYLLIAGLEDYLKCQLRLEKPASCSEAVALAHLYEQNSSAKMKARLRKQNQRLGNPVFSGNQESKNRVSTVKPRANTVSTTTGSTNRDSTRGSANRKTESTAYQKSDQQIQKQNQQHIRNQRQQIKSRKIQRQQFKSWSQ